jgi:hypothetical protein
MDSYKCVILFCMAISIRPKSPAMDPAEQLSHIEDTSAYEASNHSPKEVTKHELCIYLSSAP